MEHSHLVRNVRWNVRYMGQDILALEVTKMMARTIWLTSMAALGSWLAVMGLDNEPPYSYDPNQSFVIPNPAPQGSIITVEWALTAVRRECPGTVQRIFRDLDTGLVATTLDTTPMSRSVRKGDKRLPRSFELPPDLPAHVGYTAEVCAQCNFLQQFQPLCFKTPEIKFHVQQGPGQRIK
jgi:hypothetical protein